MLPFAVFGMVFDDNILSETPSACQHDFGHGKRRIAFSSSRGRRGATSASRMSVIFAGSKGEARTVLNLVDTGTSALV